MKSQTRFEKYGMNLRAIEIARKLTGIWDFNGIIPEILGDSGLKLAIQYFLDNDYRVSHANYKVKEIKTDDFRYNRFGPDIQQSKYILVMPK